MIPSRVGLQIGTANIPELTEIESDGRRRRTMIFGDFKGFTLILINVAIPRHKVFHSSRYVRDFLITLPKHDQRINLNIDKPFHTFPKPSEFAVMF